MKKIINTILFLLIATAAMCEDLPNTLVVKLRSGETADFQLANGPKLTFEGKLLVVKSETYEVTYDLSRLSSYYFKSDKSDGVAAPGTSGQSIEKSNARLQFRGLKAGSEVTVCSVGGVVMSSVKAGNDGCAVVSLESMPQGAYVVKYGNVSTKIRKR